MVLIVVLLQVGVILWVLSGCEVPQKLRANSKTCWVGCLVPILAIVIIACVAQVMTKMKEEADQAKIAAEERQRQDAEEMRIKMRKEKIKAFALKEAPRVWSTYQSLQSEIDLQNGRIDDLAKSLRAFDRLPEQDEDFVRICKLRDEMVRTLETLWRRMEDAYLAAKKYEATPASKNNKELMDKAIEDGIIEADAAAMKFNDMRLLK